MRVLYIVLISFILFGLKFAQAEQNQEQIKISVEETGPSCKKIFPSNDTISLNQVYVKHKEDGWIPVTSTNITWGATKRIPIWDAERGKKIYKDVYEYVYIDDFRELKEEKYAYVGIVASRYEEESEHTKINLYKNKNELQTSTTGQRVGAYNASVVTDYYQGYIKEPKRAKDEYEIEKINMWMGWVNVNEETKESDKSREEFLYRGHDKKDNRWKISLRLRVLTGSVSCVRFQLAHNAGVRSVKLHAFIQRKNEENDVGEFSAGFSN